MSRIGGQASHRGNNKTCLLCFWDSRSVFVGGDREREKMAADKTSQSENGGRGERHSSNPGEESTESCPVAASTGGDMGPKPL